MGSPIDLSGLNNVSFPLVLNARMQQERRPLLSLQTHATGLEAQRAAYGTLATKLGALETAVKALADADAFGGRTVTNTDLEPVGTRFSAASAAGRSPSRAA